MVEQPSFANSVITQNRFTPFLYEPCTQEYFDQHYYLPQSYLRVQTPYFQSNKLKTYNLLAVTLVQKVKTSLFKKLLK